MEWQVPTLSEEQQERVRAWIRELRGENGRVWPQGRHGLVTLGPDGEPAGFCCLGVACEVAVAGGAPVRWENTPAARRYYWPGFLGPDSSTTSLPPVVMEWFGFDLSAPLVLPQGGVRPPSVIQLNDTAGFTFAQIADRVEQTYLPQDWEVRQGADVA